MRRMVIGLWVGIAGWMGLLAVQAQLQPDLEALAIAPEYQSKRVSSADPSGGNEDWIRIEPGETKILAEIEGPGAITHIWNTLSAERYAARMLILQAYWDGETTPSIEVPLGDFFGVGHGLQRAFQSFPVAVSSEGRARNCYWYMPFQQSAKITLTHEGFFPVDKFYYAIDYRTLPALPEDSLYFHAQYRQQTPNLDAGLGDKNLNGLSNYVVLDTNGSGQYVGTVLSAQMNRAGWFGEGDEMIFIDGEEQPSIVGTGTEDYFNEAWGFRAFSFPFHGVTVWEGNQPGSRGTAYKWHIADPIAFESSLKVTIEHGHANDREDDWYSVAYWYQTLPSPTPPAMPNVFDRLPDEGQQYAQRVFLNQEIRVHEENGRFEDAVNRIEAFLLENPQHNSFGYWSLQKGKLFKHKQDIEAAEFKFNEAARFSANHAGHPKAHELDAEAIRQIARLELKALDSAKTAQLYVVAEWRDAYEIYLDGDLIAEGSGGQYVQVFEVRVGGGRHVLAARYIRNSPLGNLSMMLSHREGYLITDESWKTSTQEAERWNQSRFDDSTWEPAGVIGKLGQGHWYSNREPYSFMAKWLHTPVLWDAQNPEAETVFFRKAFRL